MTDEHGDQEPLTWRERRQMERAERLQRQALSTRNAQHAKDSGLLSRLEKLVRVPVVREMPRTEPLNDAETNARARMLQVQAETLRAQAQMTDEEYEQRKQMLEQQRRELLK